MNPALSVVSFVLCFLVYTLDALLDIVTGSFHNCVFEPGATGMKCWGYNAYGQLGLGDTNDRGDEDGEMGVNLAIVVLGANFVANAALLSMGWLHSCATSQDHAAKCWGDGEYYQLGHANRDNLGDGAGEMVANVSVVEFRADFLPFKVAAGGHHTCVVSTGLQLVCFGDNSAGQCGAGTFGSSELKIMGPPSNISAVDLGSNFTLVNVFTFWRYVCAISQQQTIKCFGANGYGQLGYGDRETRGLTPESMGDGLPVISLGRNFTPKAVAVGAYHTCVLSTAKTVKCFGQNAQGQCGQATPAGTNNDIGDEADEMGDNLPVLVFPAGFVPAQMALGAWHACILSVSAQVVCFGYNNYGQLGIGHTTSTYSMGFNFTPVNLGTDFVPRKITAGHSHTCAISTVDDIKCWGKNWNGQLGLGHTNDVGNEPDEMGDNLLPVDVGLTASPTKAPTTTPAQQSSPRPTPSQATHNLTVMVTIQSDAYTNSTQMLSVVVNAFNLTTTPIVQRQYDSNGVTSVEFLIAFSSNVPLDSDVIGGTLREAMVKEYGEDVVDVTVENQETQVTQSPSLLWLVYVGASIAGVCLCFTLVGVVKCTRAKRHRQRADSEHQVEHQVEMQRVPLPVLVVPNVHVYSERSDSEQKEDIPDSNAMVNEPGAGGPDLENEDAKVDDSDDDGREEGLRSSVVTQPVTSGGLQADEFEIVTAGEYNANYVHTNLPKPTPDGLQEDEFVVIDDKETAMDSATIRGE